MTKITANAGQIKDKEGNAIDPNRRSAGAGASFQLIAPDFYLAVVKGLTFGEYRAAFKGFPNKDAKDHKWTYWKFTPDVQLLNPSKTIINRQDIQVGVAKDGNLIRPDGDKDKSALWTGAQYLLGALGLLSTDESGEFKLDFDTEHITDRIVKVKTGVGGYIKGETGYDVKQMNTLLLEQNDGQPYEFEDIPALVSQWNEDNGYEDDGEIRLKTKNIITNYYGVDLRTIEDYQFYLDEVTGAVFITELDYNNYLAAVDATDSYVAPNL